MNSTLLLGLMPVLCWLVVTPLSPAQCLSIAFSTYLLIYCSQSLFYSPASAHGRCLLGNLVKQSQVAANLGETEGFRIWAATKLSENPQFWRTIIY